jgi:hypothetical protein
VQVGGINVEVSEAASQAKPGKKIDPHEGIVEMRGRRAAGCF